MMEMVQESSGSMRIKSELRGGLKVPHQKIVARETTKCEVCITFVKWALNSVQTIHYLAFSIFHYFDRDLCLKR